MSLQLTFLAAPTSSLVTRVLSRRAEAQRSGRQKDGPAMGLRVRPGTGQVEVEVQSLARLPAQLARLQLVARLCRKAGGEVVASSRVFHDIGEAVIFELTGDKEPVRLLLEAEGGVGVAAFLVVEVVEVHRVRKNRLVGEVVLRVEGEVLGEYMVEMFAGEGQEEEEWEELLRRTDAEAKQFLGRYSYN